MSRTKHYSSVQDAFEAICRMEARRAALWEQPYRSDREMVELAQLHDAITHAWAERRRLECEYAAMQAKAPALYPTQSLEPHDVFV